MPAALPAFKEFMTVNPDAMTGTGAADVQIAAAERELGISFPGVFRRYLSELGYLELRSAEFFGLGMGVPPHLDLVDNTQTERTVLQPCIPHHLLPFMANGGGDHYCIDLSEGKEDPCVVFWDHGLDSAQHPKVLAETFTSWLLHHTDEWS